MKDHSEPNHPKERIGGWIWTYTGGQLYPLDPRPDEINIKDIAHALSMQCRYNGHCREFYSVAQHSVHVAQHCSSKNKLWGLLHDAPEYALSDVVRPIKPKLAGYQEYEDNLMRVIATRFALDGDVIPNEVERIDTAILADEKAQLMGTEPAPWILPEPPLGIRITPWSPDKAEAVFLAHFEEYILERDLKFLSNTTSNLTKSNHPTGE